MPAHLEVWRRDGPRLVLLENPRSMIGKGEACDVRVETDAAVSTLHAVLERFQRWWVVRDLGSRNGTFVNGVRIHSEHRLRSGEEIRVGSTRIVFRDDVTGTATRTETASHVPNLTERERDVLVALCRPMIEGDVFTQPATNADLSSTLHLSEAAVKKHLVRLYRKFGLSGGGPAARARLANDAIDRGVVTVAELRSSVENRSP